jgi:hypothetical protein
MRVLSTPQCVYIEKLTVSPTLRVLVAARVGDSATGRGCELLDGPDVHAAVSNSKTTVAGVRMSMGRMMRLVGSL